MANPKTSGNKEGAELLMSLAFLLVSGLFTYFSVVMENPESWVTAPGLLPFLLAASLFVMAAIMAAGSISRGGLAALFGAHDPGDDAGEGVAPRPGFFKASGRVLTAMVAVAVLYFGLLRVLPFEISILIFFLFMTHFYWPEASLRKRLTVSLLLPLVISGVFAGGFGIPLPGQNNIVEMLTFELRR